MKFFYYFRLFKLNRFRHGQAKKYLSRLSHLKNSNHFLRRNRLFFGIVTLIGGIFGYSKLIEKDLIIKAKASENFTSAIADTTEKNTSLIMHDPHNLATLLHLFQKGHVMPLMLYIMQIGQSHPGLNKAIFLFEYGYTEAGIKAINEIFLNDLSGRAFYLLIKGIIYNYNEEYTAALMCFDKVLENSPPHYLSICTLYHKYLALEKSNFNLEEAQKIFLHLKSYQDIYRFEELENIYITLKKLIPYYSSNLLERVDEKRINRHVVVRIWQESLWDKLIHGYVGHISLQTDQHYISFWPGEQSFYNLFEDLTAKVRLPDKKFVIDELDTETINKQFLEFKKSACQWSIFGSTKYLKHDLMLNCCGLTLALLEKAGIESKYHYSELLGSTANRGIFGEAVLNVGGPYLLLAVRISFIYLVMSLYYYSICYVNHQAAARFLQKITLPKYPLLCGAITSIIPFLSTKFDQEKELFSKEGIKNIGGGFAIGTAFGGAIFYSVRHLAATRALVPSQTKLALSSLLFFAALFMFGERSFMTRWAGRTFGFLADTATGQGLVITPDGIRYVLERVINEKESNAPEFFQPLFQVKNTQKSKQIEANNNSGAFFKTLPKLCDNGNQEKSQNQQKEPYRNSIR